MRSLTPIDDSSEKYGRALFRASLKKHWDSETPFSQKHSTCTHFWVVGSPTLVSQSKISYSCLNQQQNQFKCSDNQ